MINGFLLLDKPAGFTSHDAVARVRKALGQRRVGHTGTLDPSATGLLIIATGRATRLIRFLDVLAKSYTCTMVLGSTTSTLDSDGEVTATYAMDHVTTEQVVDCLPRFRGEISQIPPMVSALKIEGKRLYDLAREGVEVERKPREVTIHDLEVASTANPREYSVRVTCSTGTYVRSLVADIGEALGGGAHLRDLRRTAIGSYHVEDARSLESLADEGTSQVIKPGDFLTHLPSLQLNAEEAARVATGRSLVGKDDDETVGPVALWDEQGELLAIYARSKSHHEWRAEVVLV